MFSNWKVRWYYYGSAKTHKMRKVCRMFKECKARRVRKAWEEWLKEWDK